MNRKIIEDVKINSHKILKTPDDVIKKEVSSNKYDFLKKINKKTNDDNQFSLPRISQTPQMPSKGRPFNKIILSAFLLSLFIGIFYLLSTVFLRTNITIVAKDKIFELKHQKFITSKNKANNIPFEIMILSDSDYKDVILTKTLEVSDKAKGEIYLYNEYSNKPVKIGAGTFVSDENGKTYKTDVAVTIPQYKLDKANIVPGQISVPITAFLSGEAYNGNPAFFTINSFKGTDKYKKIYGKPKTPLSGGMAGLVYVLDDKEKENLLSSTASFKEKLFQKLGAQVPVGYILYPDAVNFSYEFGENLSSKTPNAKIEMKGTLSAILLKESELSNFLINKLLPNLSPKERSEIMKPNPRGLSFNFVNKEMYINKDIESFEFELTGELLINWRPDLEEIKTLLVDKNKNEIPAIFKEDPAIASASVKIIPFWSKKMPSSLKNINITIKNLTKN